MIITRKWFKFQYASELILKKSSLMSVKFVPLFPSFKFYLMDCLSNQCFSYSSVLEKYRTKALNDFMCRTVMKQGKAKLPIGISRRHFLLAALLNRQLKAATYTIAVKRNVLRQCLKVVSEWCNKIVRTCSNGSRHISSSNRKHRSNVSWRCFGSHLNFKVYPCFK